MTRFLSLRITWSVLFILYIGMYSAHALYLNKTIFGDGIYYYSWLRSLAVDHDINFTNDYSLLGGTQPLLSNGLPGNKYSIGPAILWSPAFFQAFTVLQGNGTSFPYHYIVGFTSVLYAFVGLVLLSRLLLKFFNKTVVGMSIAAIALCTNLLFYGSVDPVNSHGLTFFSVTLFLTFLFEKKIALAAGVLALVGSIRPQDLLLGIFLIGSITRKNITSTITLFSLGFIPQLLVWYTLYGSFINPYLSGGEGFSLFSPHILEVLFAPWYGLITVTPIVLLGFAGLAIARKKIFLTVILLEVYLVSSWSTWWQGASYGARMLISVLPLLGFGIATLLKKLPNRTLTLIPLSVILPLFLINCLQIVWFLIKT